MRTLHTDTSSTPQSRRSRTQVGGSGAGNDHARLVVDRRSSKRRRIPVLIYAIHEVNKGKQTTSFLHTYTPYSPPFSLCPFSLCPFSLCPFPTTIPCLSIQTQPSDALGSTPNVYPAIRSPALQPPPDLPLNSRHRPSTSTSTSVFAACCPPCHPPSSLPRKKRHPIPTSTISSIRTGTSGRVCCEPGSSRVASGRLRGYVVKDEGGLGTQWEPKVERS
jgi:hypothetical protein